MITSNINYQLSCFGDYSSLSYTNENVISILNEYSDISLLPVAVAETLEDMSLSPRLSFISQDNTFGISVLSNRIDIRKTANIKEGFMNEELDEIAESLRYNLNKITEKFANIIPEPNRLAWFTSYVMFEMTKKEISDYRDRFITAIPFYDENRLDDMMVRFGVRREVKIIDKNEKINILTTVNRYETVKMFNAEVNGYKVDFDINTWQINKKPRFTSDDIVEFIKVARDFQNQAKADVL